MRTLQGKFRRTVKSAACFVYSASRHFTQNIRPFLSAGDLWRSVKKQLIANH